MAPNIIHTAEEQAHLITNSRRPRFRANSGPNEPAINSILLRREWEALDARIIESYRQRSNMVADLRAAGLTTTTTLAEMMNSWRVGSERRRPDITMDGRSRVDRDRSDRKTFSVPIPIIATTYEIGMRELMASRAVGSDIDTFEAQEAGQAVAEEEEILLIDGNSEMLVQGEQVYGVTNHPDRLSDTASNFGGGDFGTLGNAYKAINGALRQLAGNRYYGPFNIYVANTQYHEMLAYHDDGSNVTELSRVLTLPQVAEVKPNDFLTAGEVVMIQMDMNVIDVRTAMGLENRQWDHPDGSAVFFKVMESLTFRLKPDYRGELGICHMTGC